VTISLVIAFSSSGAAGDSAVSPSADSRASKTARVSAPEYCPSARRGVAFYRGRYLHHRARMGAGRPTTPAGLTASCSRVRPAVSIWKARALVARHTANAVVFIRETRKLANARRALYEKWRCIHEHEGAWDDPNPPYWGGLQMDMAFMRSHGSEFLARWGTADRWPVWAQIAAAEDAYKTRGFGPWPNTRRMCGQ
jgi:hypothetical protein